MATNNEELKSKVEELRQQINHVFVGKEREVELLFACMLADGHLLLEDVPGVGKTTLAKALAKSMNCSLGRIQFTPDTLPGDVIGVSIYNQKTGDFEFRPGVVMNQILLADEINRTTPKTQSSLLEAMAERQVTVDGVVNPLPNPFMVIATQNPIEFLGTYPLPEAQMDRFMMRLSLGYPSRDQEIKMVRQSIEGIVPESVKPVITTDEISEIKEQVRNVTIADSIIGYMEDIVTLTRGEERFVLGVSPRGLLALMQASRAWAYLQNRDYVKPDDVKAVARAVLVHRLVLTPQAKGQKQDAGKIFDSLVLKAKVPVC